MPSNSIASTFASHPTDQKVPEMPRPEYPRPHFQRDETSWLNLNGAWEFEFVSTPLYSQSDLNNFVTSHNQLTNTIQVPFAFQSKLSGIADPGLHDYMWYARDFEVPDRWANEGKRIWLRFGAVDYNCQVWVNGDSVGEHQGGHVGFDFDITNFLKVGQANRLMVYVEDTQSKTQPRGKQYWEAQSEFCFYTRTSGIWQTVWLEAVAPVHLSQLQVQADIELGEVALLVDVSGVELKHEIYWLQIEIGLAGNPVWSGELGLVGGLNYSNRKMIGRISLPNPHLWSPETPHLYDLHLSLYCGKKLLDEVDSYFGMRKISTKNGQVWLNNQPYYLRMVLDQGYFPDGLLTAPSDDALRQDIEMAKAFGFNGVRKHQKIEDPRWLYWADRLGILVWGEMPSTFEWNVGMEWAFIREWLQAIVRDYNHPCIMAWVPFNESWGIGQIASSLEQQKFVQNVVALTRGMDSTRLVIDNDGWEHLERSSDLLTIHDYTAHGAELIERYHAFRQSRQASHLPSVSERPILLDEAGYENTPIIFSEFGGMSLIPANQEQAAHTEGEWGYSNAHDGSSLIAQYQSLMIALRELGFTSGFCYTQLTDVEQEVNGLLTYQRELKVDPAVIAALNQIPQFDEARVSQLQRAG